MVSTTITNKQFFKKNLLSGLFNKTKIILVFMLGLFCLECVSSESVSQSLDDLTLESQNYKNDLIQYYLEDFPDQVLSLCSTRLNDKHYTSHEIIEKVKQYESAENTCKAIKNSLHDAGYETESSNKGDSGLELFKFIYRAYVHNAVRFSEISAFIDEQQNIRNNTMITILKESSQNYFSAFLHMQKIQKIVKQQLPKPKAYYGRF